LHLIGNEKKSKQLQFWYNLLEAHLVKPILKEISEFDKDTKLTAKENIYYGKYLRTHFKRSIFELIDIFCKLDAFLSMAIACKNMNLFSNC